MEVSELVRSLLEKRGIVAAEDVATFLEPSYEEGTHDPCLMPEMARAVSRLLLAMEAGERVAVYADFDCDGIPGAALLSDFFKKIGYANVELYIPHRDREGYGFHKEAIAALADRGVSLIITVDVGTVAHEGVSFAKEKGVDVIVTDHHELSEKSPEAFALLNPKREGYPFPDLCGAAVAWKLVQATLVEGRRRGLSTFVAIPEGWEKWLLDMVAIATVADMVSLVGENRVLAHWGLKVLRKSPRRGIRALCEKLRLRQPELAEDDIGFSIAPRINAASRMDDPELALRLLTTDDSREAHELAAKLETLNASRKGIVAGIVKKARKKIAARYAAGERVMVAGDPEWRPSLLGLAANSIMNERGGMVCLWGRDASGALKGSCRADESISVTDVFAQAGDAFIECGGHKRSGGFTVSPERIHELPELLRAAAERAAVGEQAPERAEDASILLNELSREFFDDVSRLSPFGVGNPKPLFRFREVVITDMKRFGKQKDHLELALECRTSGARRRGFDFFRAPESFTHAPARGQLAHVLATVERDSYRGGLALRIVDIVIAP